MNNIILPRQENGQAPDHSDSRYSSGALGNVGFHGNGGGGVIEPRRIPALFFRDSQGHIQYLCPNNELHSDDDGHEYYQVRASRFHEFEDHLDRIGQHLFDVINSYRYEAVDFVQVYI